MHNESSFFHSLFIVLFCATASVARVVNVSTYVQLRDACQNALPGDTIVIASGTYTITGASRIMITNRQGPVLVKGATGNPTDVTVQGQGQDNSAVQMVFNLDDCPAWTFRDFTVRNSYYHGFKFDHNSTDCALINVIMRDHGESGVKGTSDPPSGKYPDRLLIDSCDIGFTSTSGGTRSVVEGVDGVGVNDWIIRNSRFVNVQKGGNPAYAIFTKGNSSNTIIEANRFENCFIGASFGGGGTATQYFRDNNTTYEHRNGIIRNNVIMRCTDAGIYINKGNNCKIYNNTVFECVLTIQLRFVQSTGYVRNNLVKRALSNPNEPIIRLRDGATMLANESNLSASNADFITPTGSYSQLDLHLKAGSSAIDAGVNVAPDVVADFEGQQRPSGQAYDVGADELGVIPVELQYFAAGAVGLCVTLEWVTASETDNYGFIIQRSFDLKEWIDRGFVAGAGTTTRSKDYRFLDSCSECPDGVMWYRLKQMDFDGRFEFSPIVSVTMASDRNSILELFPNPVERSNVIHISIRTQSPASILISDVHGHEMIRANVPATDSGGSTINIPVHTLDAGVYFVRIESDGAITFRRFIVQR